MALKRILTGEYLVRLRGPIDLPIHAHSPEHACDQIARLHPALGEAILLIGSDQMDMTGVRGRCEKCTAWVLEAEGRSAPMPRAKVICGPCAKGKPTLRPVAVPTLPDQPRRNMPVRDSETTDWTEADRRNGRGEIV